MTEQNNSRAHFLTVKQLSEKYAFIPAGGIRHLIFTNKNDFNKRVVRKLGRKILINENEFLNFIDEQAKKD